MAAGGDDGGCSDGGDGSDIQCPRLAMLWSLSCLGLAVEQTAVFSLDWFCACGSSGGSGCIVTFVSIHFPVVLAVCVSYMTFFYNLPSRL